MIQENPKSEALNPKQYQMTKIQMQGAELNSASPILNFEFRYLNLFRISNLGFTKMEDKWQL